MYQNGEQKYCALRESDFGTKPETPSRHSESQLPALTLVLRDSWFSEVRSILFSKQKASGHGGLGICEDFCIFRISCFYFHRN